MRILLRAALCAVFAFASCLVSFAKPTIKPHQVEFFEAIEARLITARVIPHDDTKVTLLVANRTKRPLAVELPGPIAAIPRAALGQIGLFDNQPQPQQSAQNLGIGLQGPGNQNFPAAFGQPGNNLRNAAPLGPGLFNIPPERTIKRVLPAVCLQHGLKTPSAHMKYEIVPLGKSSRDIAVRRVLEKLVDKRCGQQVAQLATWHLANDVSWQSLSEKRKIHANGRSEPQYQAGEIKHARKLADWATGEAETVASR